MPYFQDQNPYAGTTVGSDGLRYDVNASDIPRNPTRAPGRGVKQSDFDPVLDTLADMTDVRQVTDAVITDADATVTSVAANFTDADLGASIGGAGAAKFPPGTVIETINAENSVEMSAPATSAGTGQTLVFTQTPGARLDSLEDRVAAVE